jgi:hypothetical protein
LTRAAAFAFTTTLAASAASIACSGDSTTTIRDAGDHDVQPPYGTPPTPQPVDAGQDNDAGGQALYGAPAYGAPFDSGKG